MNITSKRLDKIKKTKNQSKRRIHYKNKKKNGKEKNRRKNRKYNKSTGKYRKTHKRKKRAYDLKNKSLKFKENQPVNKSAPLKIITTDKPVETVQTGGGLWDKFKKIVESVNAKKRDEIDDLKEEKERLALEEKKAEKEQRAKNIKANIKTQKFNAFLKEVKKDNGPYSEYLTQNIGDIINTAIAKVKVKVKEENLVEIYDYLMKTENQDKIQKSLNKTGNTDELNNFNAMIESIELARFAKAPYPPPQHNPTIMVVKPGDHSDDPAVISTNTSDLKTTDALVDLGNFKKHVTATKKVVDNDQPQSGGDIYNMMLKYNTNKTTDQWKDKNWVQLGKTLAGLIDNDASKQNFLNDLKDGEYGEAMLVAGAMQKVLENIDGENKMRFGYAYANNDDLDGKIATAMAQAMGNMDDKDVFNLKAIIRGTDKLKCNDGPKEQNGSRSVGHFDSFVKLDDNDKYVYFDASKKGTTPNNQDIPEIVNIKDYLPNDLSCNFLIFLFNNDKEYPTTENLKDLKVTTEYNGKNRCWINATLYAVLFGIMNKGNENSEEE